MPGKKKKKTGTFSIEEDADEPDKSEQKEEEPLPLKKEEEEVVNKADEAAKAEDEAKKQQDTPQKEEEEEEQEEEEEEDEKADRSEAEEDAEPAAEAGSSAAAATSIFDFVPHGTCPAMEAAVWVVYCPTCGLPPDFCQYGPSWEKCKPWCMENFPHFYPQLSGVSLDDAKKSAQAAVEKGKEKILPGGKKKREVSPHIAIRKLTRGGRKCVTSVSGLEGFGVKPDAAAKVFKKKFSCGCSVLKGENGAPDCVDIQGDFEYEVVDLLVAEFPSVPRNKVTFLEGGTKKKGKSKA